MAEMLPPLIYEMRARFGEVIGGLKEVQHESGVTARKAEEDSARVGSSFGKWGKFAKVGAAGVLAAGAIVAVEGVKMAGDFQQQTMLLHTAGGELESNMKLVSDGILKLSVSTGTSTEQLTEGMYTLEKANLRGAEGLEVLKAAAQGAKAENVDLATATNALSSVMMSYHFKAKDAVAVENMLVEGSGKAKTTMEEYAGSLSTVIPVASAAGVSFDQVAGAIATLTQHGTSAHEATQELANTIRGLQAPNKVAQAAMQQVGLSAADLSANLGKRGLTGTLDIVYKALGKQEPGGMVALGIYKKSAQAAQDLKKMIGGMPPDLARMAQAVQGGSMNLTAFTKAARGLSPEQQVMARQFMMLYRQSTGFSDALRSGQPDVVTFAGALSKIMGGATGMNTALMLGGENMGFFKEAAADVSKAGKKAGKDISTWAQTSKLFNVEMAQAKQAVEVFTIKVGQKLIPIIQSGIGWVEKHRAGFEALGRWVVDVATKAYDGVFRPLLQTVGGVIQQVSAWVEDHKTGLIQVAHVIESVMLRVGKLWVAAIRVEIAVIKDLAKIVGWAWNNVIAPTARFISRAWQDVSRWTSALGTTFAHVWDGIQSKVGAVWHWIDSNVIHPVETAFGAVGSALSAMGGVFSSIWQGIKNAVQDAWNFISPLIDMIRQAVNDVVGLVHDAQGAWNSVNSTVHKGGNWNPINWFEDGGWVQASRGTAMPAMVHGGEYVLSTGMLDGRQAVDQGVLSKLMASQNKAASYAGWANAGGGGGGGGGTVIEHHTHVYVDGKKIQKSVERRQLQVGARRGGASTYAPYSR